MSLHDDRRGRSRSESSQRCHNCDSFISQQFARVFGDNQDNVHACIECSTLSSLREGKAGGGD